MLNYTIILKITKVPLFGSDPPPQHTHFSGASAACEVMIMVMKVLGNCLIKTMQRKKW